MKVSAVQDLAMGYSINFVLLSDSIGLASTSRTESSSENQRTTATVSLIITTATHSSQPHSSSYVPALQTTVQSLSLTTSSLSSPFTLLSRNYSITTAVDLSLSPTLLSEVGSVNVSTASSLELTRISKETSRRPSVNSTQQSRVLSTAANSFQSKFQQTMHTLRVMLSPFSIYGEKEAMKFCCRILT